MFLKLLRTISRFILRLIARVELIDFDNVPQDDTIIVVTNHLGRLDVLLGYILVDRPDVIMMVAEKYEKVALWRWVGKKLGVIWVNRFDADIHALRETTRRLKQGGILAIAPEGVAVELIRRSGTGCAVHPADVDGLVSILEEISSDYQRFKCQCYDPQPNLVQEYERRLLTRRLANVFDSVLMERSLL